MALFWHVPLSDWQSRQHCTRAASIYAPVFDLLTQFSANLLTANDDLI